jgi:hypothetical protein
MANVTTHGGGAYKRPGPGHRDRGPERSTSPPVEGCSRRKEQGANLRLQGSLFAAIVPSGSSCGGAGAVERTGASLPAGAADHGHSGKVADGPTDIMNG